VYLAEIIINQCLDTGLRQMAAVMLKQYAEKNWCLEDTEESMKYFCVSLAFF
jgi:hypothetical protein